MIVRKVISNNVAILALNENEDIEEVKSLEYAISVENKNEYNSEIELLITKFLLNGIKVYQYNSNTFKLEYVCERILLSQVMIVIFETHDESKFEILENTIKEFMIMHKDKLNLTN